MTGYRTLAAKGEAELVIQRSRFIGRGFPVESEAAALAILADIRKAHWDASHNCFAYRIGPDGGCARYSDDGEPGGTAGLPMMEVLKSRGLTDLLVVVTRYFGGILLGAGGLTRAYSKGARDALAAAGVATMGLWARVRLSCPYPLFERVKLEITACGGVVRDTEYGADIRLRAAFPAGGAELFVPRLTELSAGSLAMEAAGEEFLPGPRESANGT